MSHRLLAVMLASLALIAGGCGSGESDSPEGETVAPEPTQGEASPVPSEPLATKPQEETKAPKKAPSATAGLIGSTDPDERAQQIQQRINAEREVGTPATSQGDPFGLLPVPPARVKASGQATTAEASLPPLPPTTLQTTRPVEDTPRLVALPSEAGFERIISQQLAEEQSTGISISTSGSRGGGSVASSPSRGGGSTSGGGGSVASSPSRGGGSASGGGGPVARAPIEPPPAASLPPLPALPPAIGPALPPEEPVATLPPLDGGSVSQLPPLPVEIGPAIPPEPVEPPAIAESITISGVVQVGNEIQVIVQLPGSSSGRYVKVGDLIADGRVRIKRVEGIQSSSPIVILEEEGVEYARGVGDLPAIAMEESDRG